VVVRVVLLLGCEDGEGLVGSEGLDSEGVDSKGGGE